MPDGWNLDRFVQAQAPVIAQVRRELAAGQKRSHWMWFVFPQLAGLGHSATARHFALHGLAEAEAYLAHPVLGPRLLDCTALANRHAGQAALAVFGSPDDLKFRSCMTLFAQLRPAPSPFAEALGAFFGAVPDPLTLQLLP